MTMFPTDLPSWTFLLVPNYLVKADYLMHYVMQQCSKSYKHVVHASYWAPMDSMARLACVYIPALTTVQHMPTGSIVNLYSFWPKQQRSHSTR